MGVLKIRKAMVASLMLQCPYKTVVPANKRTKQLSPPNKRTEQLSTPHPKIK